MARINDLPKEDCPREKALKKGIKSLTNSELLALIIGCGTKKLNAIEVSQNLLLSCENLSNISNLSISELKRFEGISTVNSLKILGALMLANRLQDELMKNLFKPSYNSLIVFKNYIHLFLKESSEIMFAIYFDRNNDVIEEKIISKGDENNLNFNIKEVFNFKNYLVRKILLIHNHLYDSCLPSNNDILSTLAIEKVANEKGIILLDHLIIFKGKYFSFFDSKLLNNN